MKVRDIIRLKIEDTKSTIECLNEAIKHHDCILSEYEKALDVLSKLDPIAIIIKTENINSDDLYKHKHCDVCNDCFCWGGDKWHYSVKDYNFILCSICGEQAIRKPISLLN